MEMVVSINSGSIIDALYIEKTRTLELERRRTDHTGLADMNKVCKSSRRGGTGQGDKTPCRWLHMCAVDAQPPVTPESGPLGLAIAGNTKQTACCRVAVLHFISVFSPSSLNREHAGRTLCELKPRLLWLEKTTSMFALKYLAEVRMLISWKYKRTMS